METKLLKDVYDDIIRFINQKDQYVFFNERDLQMHLAVYLQKSPNNYDDVEVEYYVPVFDANGNKILKEYDWDSEIRLDIVVIKENEFLPIEIKYKTRKIRQPDIFKRFNKEIHNVDILKNHSAQDLGCYDFWKDVKRIEVIKDQYEETVKGGIALFLTNDKYYWKDNIKENTAYYNFRLSKDNKTLNKEWTSYVSVKKNHPNFKINKIYNTIWVPEIHFQDCKKEEFRCFLAKVF